MITFAVYNSKGGVGKTASAVNLSYLSALEGKRTLIWDLDPQASATFYYRVKPKVKGGAKKLIDGKHDLEDFTKSTEYDGLDVIPADFSERHLDIMLDDMKKSKKRLKKILHQMSDYYDVIIIDAPPGFSLLSENIFLAVDWILLPMIPSTLSLRTYEQIKGYFDQKDLDKKRIIPFFALVDRRKKMHKTILEEGRKDYTNLLESDIPYSSEVEKMGLKRAPLLSFSKKSKPAVAYKNLWEEIKTKTDFFKEKS